MILSSITDAKRNLNKLIEESDQNNVVIIKNSQPVAVLISNDRYRDLVEMLEDYEDRLAVAAVQDEATIPFNPADYR